MARRFFAFCTLVAVANGLTLPDPNKPVKSELVTVRSLSERSADGSRRLHVRAFGEDHRLHLEPASSIFAPDFKAFSVRSLPDGSVAFEDTAENQIKQNEAPGNFYTIKGQPGSLYINDDNGLHVEGLLSDGLRITPHNEDQSANDERNHIVYQEEIMGLNDLPIDYIIPNVSRFEAERQSGGWPSTVNVEILLLFDHLGTKRLGYDENRIKRYLGVFWNRINQLYMQTNNPRINLVLSGLMYFNRPEDQPFLNNNQVDEMRALESLLPAMGKWLKESESKFPRYDVAFLQLTPDIGKMENGQFKGTVAGVAYLGGTCNYVEIKCCYGQDRAPSYWGLATAAHELAHTLGAHHDSDVDGCRNDKGFIMSGGEKWSFSKCSLESMANHVRSNNGRCTWDSPVSRINLINEFPSETAGNLDEQCQARKNDPNMEYKGGEINEKTCEGLKCGPKGQNWFWQLQYTTEGTPCGQQKVCKSGICVGQFVPSVQQQCQQFGNDHTAWRTDDPNICSRLWCTKDQRQLLSSGGAKNGSPCGKGKGICVSGKCYS